MRTRWVVLFAAAVVIGAAAGSFLAPQPADAVSREIIQLQQQVATLIQGQRELQSSLDANFATLKTLLNQSADSMNHVTTTMGALQRSVQDVQASTGAKVDGLTSQVQGLSDSLDDLKARQAKLSQQLAELQQVVQSLDAKISAGAPMPGQTPGGANPSGPGAASGGGPSSPAPSADVLYTNALRDFNAGNYDLSHQEFSGYMKYYPNTDLASNAQFYLGEIAYAQGQYKAAIQEYDRVLTNYPKSFKLAAARLKKAYALLQIGEKSGAIREFREVIRRNPGTLEERRARAKLRELGATTTGR